MAAGIWRSIHPRAGYPYREHPLHRFHVPRHPGAERSVYLDFLWDRHYLGAGPRHRAQISGQPNAARSLSQALIVYLLAVLLGVHVDLNPLALIGVMLVVVLGAAFFSTFSLIMACLVKTRERFMGIGQVLTMPLFFASNAIYPISIMPGWLKVISYINPLTYEVDALRSLMLAGETSQYGIGLDLMILVLATAIFVAVGSMLYPRVAT
jgi:ABC-2 type transport system permease protein